MLHTRETPKFYKSTNISPLNDQQLKTKDVRLSGEITADNWQEMFVLTDLISSTLY